MSERHGVRLKGLVLRKAPYRDNDELVTALTEGEGKIVFSAKGVKSIKCYNRIGVGDFTYSEFVLNDYNGSFSLSEASALKSFDFSSDLDSLYLASYVCEAVDHVCMEKNNEDEVLSLALNTLYALSEKLADADTVKAVFELRLLHCLGMLPFIEECEACGEQADGMYIADGEVVCPKCMMNRQDKRGFFVSGDTVRLINYLYSCPPKKILQSGINVGSEIVSFAENYLLFSLQCSFKSLKGFHEMRKL